jgi:hypothetical protein
MPWPKEEPTGENPPDGAILNYFLIAEPKGPVTLEIAQADGKIVRRYSSDDLVARIPEAAAAPVPLYWYRQPQPLGATRGMHRFVWDVHYQPLPEMPGGAGGGFGGRGGLPIQAIPRNSAPGPATPWVAPGTYTATLTVNGKRYSKPIVVKQDPRVKTPALAMQQVYTLTKDMYFGALAAHAAAIEAGKLRAEAVEKRKSATGTRAAALDAFIRDATAIEGTAGAPGGGRGRGAPPTSSQAPVSQDTLWAVRASLAGLMNSMQAADVAPTANTLGAVNAALATAARVMARWRAVKAVYAPADTRASDASRSARPVAAARSRPNGDSRRASIKLPI